MPFQPRHKKAGGRQKGIPNKRTQAKLLGIEEYCATKKYDPIHALVDIANDEQYDVTLRIQCHKAIAEYLYSKRKAVELSAPNDERLNIVVELTKAAE